MKMYSLSTTWKFFYGIYALVGIAGAYIFLQRLLAISNKTTTSSLIILYLGIFIFIYAAVSGGYSLLKAQIRFSSETVDYRTFLIVFSTKWKDISKLEVKKNRFNQEGIYIKSQAAKGWPVIGAHPDGLDVFIPVFMFVKSWRDSDLGQQIKQHAPHLFEKEKSA